MFSTIKGRDSTKLEAKRIVLHRSEPLQVQQALEAGLNRGIFRKWGGIVRAATSFGLSFSGPTEQLNCAEDQTARWSPSLSGTGHIHTRFVDPLNADSARGGCSAQ